MSNKSEEEFFGGTMFLFIAIFVLIMMVSEIIIAYGAASAFIGFLPQLSIGVLEVVMAAMLFASSIIYLVAASMGATKMFTEDNRFDIITVASYRLGVTVPVLVLLAYSVITIYGVIPNDYEWVAPFIYVVSTMAGAISSKKLQYAMNLEIEVEE